MNYAQFVQALQVEGVLPLNNTDTTFEKILPRLIEHGENRIYREMDFLCTHVKTTAACTTSQRTMDLPSNALVNEYINIITPAGSSVDGGTRGQLTRTSPAVLDVLWPGGPTATGTPTKFSIIGQFSSAPVGETGGSDARGSCQIAFGPTPDGAYTLEFLVEVRPTPLSPLNTTTFLSTVIPDMFFAACMTFLSTYQERGDRDVANMKNWESIYQSLRDAVSVEELRKKSESMDWTPLTPSVLANRSRTDMGAPASAGR